MIDGSSDIHMEGTKHVEQRNNGISKRKNNGDDKIRFFFPAHGSLQTLKLLFFTFYMRDQKDARIKNSASRMYCCISQDHIRHHPVRLFYLFFLRLKDKNKPCWKGRGRLHFVRQYLSMFYLVINHLCLMAQ